MVNNIWQRSADKKIDSIAFKLNIIHTFDTVICGRLPTATHTKIEQKLISLKLLLTEKITSHEKNVSPPSPKKKKN